MPVTTVTDGDDVKFHIRRVRRGSSAPSPGPISANSDRASCYSAATSSVYSDYEGERGSLDTPGTPGGQFSFLPPRNVYADELSQDRVEYHVAATPQRIVSSSSYSSDAVSYHTANSNPPSSGSRLPSSSPLIGRDSSPMPIPERNSSRSWRTSPAFNSPAARAVPYTPPSVNSSIVLSSPPAGVASSPLMATPLYLKYPRHHHSQQDLRILETARDVRKTSLSELPADLGRVPLTPAARSNYSLVISPASVPWRAADPQEWTNERVLYWLEANRFGPEWIDTFRLRNIHGSQFLSLVNYQNLKKLGLSSKTEDHDTSTSRFIHILRKLLNKSSSTNSAEAGFEEPEQLPIAVTKSSIELDREPATSERQGSGTYENDTRNIPRPRINTTSQRPSSTLDNSGKVYIHSPVSLSLVSIYYMWLAGCVFFDDYEADLVTIFAIIPIRVFSSTHKIEFFRIVASQPCSISLLWVTFRNH
jgi:hypothetical protein